MHNIRLNYAINYAFDNRASIWIQKIDLDTAHFVAHSDEAFDSDIDSYSPPGRIVLLTGE